MRKNHIVKEGRFVVEVAHTWILPSHRAYFKSYENAYSFLRFRCNCLGWKWGTLRYLSFGDAAPVLIVLVDREDEYHIPEGQL